MQAFFGRKKKPEEIVRENQRLLKKTMRELDREKQQLENQQTKLKNDIKKMAKEGQVDAVKIMAKDLVRQRAMTRKIMMMRANIQSVSLKLTTVKSVHSMSQAMGQTTKAMQKMNASMNLPAIQKILMEFSKQNDMMDMKEEMMQDAMDDVFEEDGDAEEEDMMVQKVFDELGIEAMGKLGGLGCVGEPGGRAAAPAGADGGNKANAPVAEGGYDDLEERLRQLKK